MEKTAQTQRTVKDGNQHKKAQETETETNEKTNKERRFQITLTMLREMERDPTLLTELILRAEENPEAKVPFLFAYIQAIRRQTKTI